MSDAIATLPESRHARFAAGLREAGCSAAVLVGPSHALHLAGYSRYFSGPVALVVDVEGRRTLVVPAYEVEAAQEEAAVDAVLPYGEPGFGLDLQGIAKLVSVAAGAVPSGRIGVAGDLPGVAEEIAATAGAQTASLDRLLHDVRMRKDVDELRAIARSFASVLEGQAAVERNALPGVSEIELFSAAQAAGQNHAGRPTGFAADLLCGARTAQVCCPVAVPGGQRLQENDVVVADVSVGNGYWGDSARTYVVGSRPEIDETYARIAEVLVAAVAELKPGTVCADVFALMEREILERFPDGSFPHHGGHGLGITTFEDPHLIPADRTPLETGMILAVEPGVYFEGRYGVRLENLYLVTPDGGIDIMEVV